eukprot:2602027-Alexandrium_andersonii.AAC.1
MLADSWVRLQGTAAQRPTESWYATRSVQFRVEGAVQAWANGRRARAEAEEAAVHVEPPDDGCRIEVEARVEAWARQLPAQPPGAAVTAAENAAVAALATWPTGTAAGLWKPLADGLQ